MKPTEIKISIQKVDEFGLSVWLGATYAIEDGETVEDSIRAAKQEIEAAHTNTQPATREVLTMTHPQFAQIVKAFEDKRVDFIECQKHYIYGDKETIYYLDENKLI